MHVTPHLQQGHSNDESNLSAGCSTHSAEILQPAPGIGNKHGQVSVMGAVS